MSKEYWPSEDPRADPHLVGPAGERSRLDAAMPTGNVLARGYVGLTPWVVTSCGDNLRIAVGRTDLDAGTPRESEQLLAFADALQKACAEVLP